ncbi:MAG TPA: hypothetical protein P5320_09200 [Bacteroidales bacterium]|nr:hypothetical protein [Bacteroidales bacterium]HOK75015.1 hypothetical protein [Bacteroidales bacterium]HOM41115.1 hypothetical protein [Bacteroidales bacterium]HPP93301.1 hypothetical protein [Bacteroidales bacterium]HRR16890.1 hypothetical protein [Bacteroidales bacterium]
MFVAQEDTHERRRDKMSPASETMIPGAIGEENYLFNYKYVNVSFYYLGLSAYHADNPDSLITYREILNTELNHVKESTTKQESEGSTYSLFNRHRQTG